MLVSESSLFNLVRRLSDIISIKKNKNLALQFMDIFT